MDDVVVLIGGDDDGRVITVHALPQIIHIPGQCVPVCDLEGWPLTRYPILDYQRCDYLGHPSRDDQGRVRYQYAG